MQHLCGKQCVRCFVGKFNGKRSLDGSVHNNKIILKWKKEIGCKGVN